MLDGQMNTLKEELNRLMAEGRDKERIYELSVRLDKLILQYYKEKGYKRNM